MGSHSISESSPGPVTGSLDAIRRIVQALRVSSRAAEKFAGLSGAQLFVLDALAEHPAQSLNQLAERTRTHQSSVSVVVQRLVDRGYVARQKSTGDARRLELLLTLAGRQALRGAPDLAQNRLIDAIEKLPADDQVRLARLLSQLVSEMGESDESPQMFFEDDSVGRTNPKPIKTRKRKSNARS